MRSRPVIGWRSDERRAGRSTSDLVRALVVNIVDDGMQVVITRVGRSLVVFPERCRERVPAGDLELAIDVAEVGLDGLAGDANSLPGAGRDRQQAQRLGVGPVQVLREQDDRCLGGDVIRQPVQPV